jgi:hypothetical protein
MSRRNVDLGLGVGRFPSVPSFFNYRQDRGRRDSIIHKGPLPVRHLEYKSVSDTAYTITMHCPHRSNALNTVALQVLSTASRGNYKKVKGTTSDAAPEEYLLHVYDTSLGVGNSALVKQYLMEPDVDVSKITTAMSGDILTITLPRKPVMNTNRNSSVPLPQVNDTILPEPEPEVEVEVEVVDPETEGVEVIDEGVVHESHYKRRDAWRGYMAYGSFHYY